MIQHQSEFVLVNNTTWHNTRTMCSMFPKDMIVLCLSCQMMFATLSLCVLSLGYSTDKVCADISDSWKWVLPAADKQAELKFWLVQHFSGVSLFRTRLLIHVTLPLVDDLLVSGTLAQNKHTEFSLTLSLSCSRQARCGIINQTHFSKLFKINFVIVNKTTWYNTKAILF